MNRPATMDWPKIQRSSDYNLDLSRRRGIDERPALDFAYGRCRPWQP